MCGGIMAKSTKYRGADVAPPVAAEELGSVMALVLHPGKIGAIMFIVDIDGGARQAHRCLDFRENATKVSIFGEPVKVGELAAWFTSAKQDERTIRVRFTATHAGGSVAREADFSYPA